MEHVSVKVALTHRVFLRGQVYRMPRNVKGIGRTGKKHKKPADGGSSRLPDQEGITGPLFTPLQDTTTKPDGQAAEASSSAEHCALTDALDKLRPFDPEAYVSCPHPGYSSGEPFLPGFRGHGGAKGEERWDPDLPPCIPSDERPDKVFGSEQAAKATAACAWLERTLPRPTEDSDEEEDEGREEREEVARVRYKHALRKLAEAFPELELPAGLYAGLHASEQVTRPCPCGAGRLARWPWVLQTKALGFCPGAVVAEDPDSPDGRHDWEDICWRGEWIGKWPYGY